MGKANIFKLKVNLAEMLSQCQGWSVKGNPLPSFFLTLVDILDPHDDEDDGAGKSVAVVRRVFA